VDQIPDNGSPVQQYEPNTREPRNHDNFQFGAVGSTVTINGIRFLSVDAEDEWQKIAIA